MRILITGGFGFIGGRLGQYLQQAGHQIILGSRKLYSSPDWLPQVNVVQTDWNDGLALEQVCGGVDIVIHTSGINAQDCYANPLAALEFNGLYTARLLQAAIHQKVKRFIYLSTAHVYASPLVGTITEDTCPRNLHPYATSHLAGENPVLYASQHGQIEGIVLRLSNVFGVPIHKGVNCWTLLVNDLCMQAVQTGKIVLRTSGLQQRDFIAMAEVCRIIETFSTRDFHLAMPGVINVGSGISQSVLEMAQFIQQRCKHVLGFEPELMRPEASVHEKKENLIYKIEKLLRLKLNNIVDNSIEIDRLLHFCYLSFNQNANSQK